MGLVMDTTSASLLERLRSEPDEADWRRLDDLYRPLIRNWLRSDPTLGEEAEDIVQEVMCVLVRELPGFQRQRDGSFRRWLRTVMTNRLGAYYRARRNRPQALGASSDESPLTQLADPDSELSRQWDEEHDRYVLRRLMQLIEPMFEPKTLAAFRRVFFDEVAIAQAAEELGMTYPAVALAKSHVLNRLRQEATGLIDGAAIF
jgi:RNA polymerase sigma-70 factor (ECF subfamily)